MSLNNALYSGVTGIQANGLSLGIIGDNIANINTVGYKAARGAFGDILAQFIPGTGGATSQLGRGVRLLDIEQSFEQGAYQTTSNGLDMAINGKGFFVLRGRHAGQDNLYYTRAGNFRLDAQGYLVNVEGLRVQGYPAVEGSDIASSLGDLHLAGVTVPPQATTRVDIGASFDPQEAVNANFDPAHPGDTGRFLSEITVYDSLGQGHRIQIYVNRTGPNTWEWHALAQSDEIQGGAADPLTQVAQGTLTFDDNGRLDQEAQAAGGGINFVGAAQNQAITFDFGDAITTDGGTGLGGSTQTATGDTYVNTNHQDGIPSGVLQSIDVDQDGNIVGGFSNGVSRVLGQVALASFQNVNGLDRVGSNLWVQTPDSGDAALGMANQHGRGSVLASTLELSNVDLTREFVSMIKAQRGFQASSKSITTADQMMAEVIGLKR